MAKLSSFRTRANVASDLDSRLYKNYRQHCPSATIVEGLYAKHGSLVKTDHSAFRTPIAHDFHYNLPWIFSSLGYRQASQTYPMKDRSMLGTSWHHPDPSVCPKFLSHTYAKPPAQLAATYKEFQVELYAHHVVPNEVKELLKQLDRDNQLPAAKADMLVESLSTAVFARKHCPIPRALFKGLHESTDRGHQMILAALGSGLSPNHFGYDMRAIPGYEKTQAMERVVADLREMGLPMNPIQGAPNTHMLRQVSNPANQAKIPILEEDGLITYENVPGYFVEPVIRAPGFEFFLVEQATKIAASTDAPSSTLTDILPNQLIASKEFFHVEQATKIAASTDAPSSTLTDILPSQLIASKESEVLFRQ